MPLASLRCRSARFDDESLNQKVKIATLKIRVRLSSRHNRHPICQLTISDRLVNRRNSKQGIPVTESPIGRGGCWRVLETEIVQSRASSSHADWLETDRYRNANGKLNRHCDSAKDLPEEDFAVFEAETALSIDISMPEVVWRVLRLHSSDQFNRRSGVLWHYFLDISWNLIMETRGWSLLLHLSRSYFYKECGSLPNPTVASSTISRTVAMLRYLRAFKWNASLPFNAT